MFKTFLNSRNKFTGNRSTKKIIYKLEMLIRIFCFPFCINRPNFKNNISKFTTTTGLFFQYLTMFDSCLECFFISNLWSTLVYFYFKLTTHTVNNDFQVQFTHSAKELFDLFLHLFLHASVGSSSTSLAIAIPILSTSACVFGSTATEITGSGINIFSKMIG